MKKILYIIVIVALLPLYSGCSREYVFDLEETSTNNNNNNNSNNNSGNNNNYAASGTIYGHEYVDLGLSVKWATCNVGANAPEDYGDYYAWGETSTKSSYTRDNCETYENDISEIKGTSRDVARVKWGGTWSMPTNAECRELKDNCLWIPAAKGGIGGYKVIGPNGNSIFLPAAGRRSSNTGEDVGEKGCYWSSTRRTENTDADELWFNGNDIYVWSSFRFRGESVRPVTK